MTAPSLPPLSLYIHIPWCVAKCPYCDFHSLPRRGALPEGVYVRAVLDDLDQSLGALRGREIQTIFFGGGTPSLFSGAAVGDILSGVGRRATLAPDCEITLEANPGTVDSSRFLAFREAGVTRLSLGVQSLHTPSLRRLGRIHDAREARDAMEAAAGAGFSSFNIDLMYGLPDQTPGQAAADVRAALAVDPPHLSLYELTIEAHTAFARDPPALPSEDLRTAIEDAITQAADAAGYERYEVSAYARPGYRCAHNLNYWQFGDYLGLGAGAHSKLTGGAAVARITRIADPVRYMEGPDRIASRRLLATQDVIFEFLLNALRLTEGFPRDLLRARTGHDFGDLEPLWSRAIARGLLAREDETMRATPLGRRFLDGLLAGVLADLETAGAPTAVEQ
ncbi:radical SAM family heme chaperone HemW [Acidiferrobacter sp.]|uniref:radical SAM family heme chaperone HemW n=1 Tax=Acidiferrobacter sp. TaxID=1872107 RepID=UPI0026141B5F|nr:radical SAM family heme chaperone HemW [Acidiferrobacter sp.]